MNIAILIPTLYGGGAERVAQIIGNTYMDRGYKVYYFLGDTNIKSDYKVKGKIVQTSIKSCLCGSSNKVQVIVNLLRASWKMRQLKVQYKIDIAISFMEEFNYLNILSKGTEKNIVSIHTILSQSDEAKNFLYNKRVIKFFYSRAGKVVVVSKYALQDMHCYYGIPLKKLVRIPNPAVELEEVDNKQIWRYGTKVIICIGRLEPVKQQEKIIRAFSYTYQKEHSAKLIILGKGTQMNYLKQICTRYNLENNVIFEGFVENVPFYLKNSRAFVMASGVEGFPCSMVEAMNYGVPIITTDSPGGCGEIVGKTKATGNIDSILYCKYGILTPYIPFERIKANDALSEQEIILGRAMLKILNEDELYERYHKQSIKRARMFSLDKVIGKWDIIIKK